MDICNWSLYGPKRFQEWVVELFTNGTYKVDMT